MRLILFLLFIHNLMAQPGPIQIQESGINNYQIQATTPTTTPIAGKQYLYNANDVLSTKDALNNVQRVNKNYDNYILNFDVEQGLTSFAGIGTLNTTTPLEGLKSINLDTTALNDFAETALVTIPRILMGQVCMAKINIKGADANLQFQVVNGAGTIIGFKQLSPFADSTPQFITFNCPTQALITATPALGQLKIKLVQSTATNAALATLDSFYLGGFESNTMVVSEGSQYYYINTNTDINGLVTWTTPSAAGAVNDKTLFTYAGTILTVLKPITMSMSASGIYNSNAGAAVNVESYFVCTSLGVARTVAYGSLNIVPNNIIYVSASASIILNPGDTCSLTFNRTNTIYINRWINITATPLPQLATIVNTNTPRAGFYAGKNWQATASCSWSGTSLGPADFAAVAACANLPRTFYGNAVADAANDGQLPQLTVAKFPKGFHQITFAGMTSNSTAAAECGLTASTSSGLRSSVSGSAFDVVSPQQTLTYFIYNPSDKINEIIKLQYVTRTGGGCAVVSDRTTGQLSISDYYMPDLSDPYSIPELYAALPPQVTNSSGKSWRTESCYITNNGTAAMASSSCNTWVQSVSRTAVGAVDINFKTGIWGLAPGCSLLTAGTTQGVACTMNNNIVTQTQANIVCRQAATGTQVDEYFYFNCYGFR